MDRDALVLRNQHMTAAFHQTPLRHHIRRWLLRIISKIPGQKLDDRGIDRVLLIRPDHLGDMLLTMPAVHALRASRPRTEIHLLAGSWSAQVAAQYDEIDTVLTLPFPGFSRNPKESLHSPYTLLLRSARMIRNIGYNAAFVLRPDHWWGAALAHMAGIPIVIGYDFPDVVPFLTDSIKHQPEHTILKSIRLIEHWTGTIPRDRIRYVFPVDSNERGYVDGYLEEWDIKPKQNVICIHPGSGTWVKRWQAERWARVADTLAGQYKASIVFTGGDHEVGLAREIVASMKEIGCIMAGDTRVGHLAALYERALLVMGPDSGPMHLAAAVDTPTVTLFGPADPAEFRPWGAPEKHPIVTTPIGCRPCRVIDWGDDNSDYHPCVMDITVGQVLEAAHRALNA